MSNSRLGVGILKTYTKITTGEFDSRSSFFGIPNKLFTAVERSLTIILVIKEKALRQTLLEADPDVGE